MWTVKFWILGKWQPAAKIILKVARYLILRPILTCENCENPFLFDFEYHQRKKYGEHTQLGAEFDIIIALYNSFLTAQRTLQNQVKRDPLFREIFKIDWSILYTWFLSCWQCPRNIYVTFHFNPIMHGGAHLGPRSILQLLEIP